MVTATAAPASASASSTSKSDAFFSSSWCFSGPAPTPIPGPYTRSSSSLSSASASSHLGPPCGNLARRASDSVLPPPWALDRDRPSSTFRSRLASTGTVQSALPTKGRQQPPSLPSLATADPALASSTGRSAWSPKIQNSSDGIAEDSALSPSDISPATSPSDIEKRLEAAVRQLETISESVDQASDNRSTNGGDDDDDEDMYYNSSEQAASTIAPFVPKFPLDPLEVVYTPQHRLVSQPLRRALRALAAAEAAVPARKSRCVKFADCVQVVDVFAAIDYLGRRGPPPIERLTMRDILELRQIKIELGVHGKNDPNAGDVEDDGTPSTPFERMNILESTPLSPASSLGPPSPFRTDFISAGAAFAGSGPTADPSAASSYQSGLSSTSLSVCTSSSSYFDSAASSASVYPNSHAQSPSGPSSSYAPGASGSIVFLDPKASHLLRERDRETSPDSLGTSGTASTSAFSSPSLSLSCSPSASDSDFLYSATDVDERDKYSLDGHEDDEDAERYEQDAQGSLEIDRLGDTTFRISEFGHARKSVRLKADSPPRRRSRNADYFKVQLPVFSRCSTATSDITSSSGSDYPEAKKLDSPSLPGPLVPVIHLDRPWGLET